MRIVFFGTPDFALASLEKLIQNKVNVVAAVTAADKPSGRGLQVQSSAIKEFCVQNKIRVLQPLNLKEDVFIKELRELNADLNIVVAFRMLPEQVWNMPRLGTYNLHASLLPKYRGAAPINWCIINNEKETGITTFKLQHQIDTGSILMFEKVNLNDTINAGELYEVLKMKGADLLLKTVKAIENAFINHLDLDFIQQDEKLVCHAPKLNKENCLINWNKPVNEIYNLIRGLSPHPGAYCFISNGDDKKKNFKILASKYTLENHQQTNGSLITDGKNFIKAYAVNGVLELTEVQLEGKKRMHVTEFLKGYRLSEHAFLE
jgi:methionyl-tRNA formyltransferase